MSYSIKRIGNVFLFSLLIIHSTHPKGFVEIVGANAIPDELNQMVDYLQKPYPNYGLRFPKGTLIIGQPGSGKTRLAKAMKEELGDDKFIYTTTSDLPGPDEVKGLFNNARLKAQLSPNGQVLIFIDDFDVFGKEASFGENGNQSETRANILALQNEMDGLDQDDSVIVVAACHSNNFNKELLRSRRFSHQITLDLPSEATRISMLNEFNKGQCPFDRSVDMNQIAKLSYNFSPADLKQIVYYANIIAKKEKSSTINKKQLSQAFITVLTNKSKTDSSLLSRLKVVINLLLKGKQEDKGFKRIVGAVPYDIQQLVNQLNGDKQYEALGIGISKGILFTGPPGTGKTTLARAIAEEAECDFMAVSGSEFIQGIIGAGAQKIRETFNEARQRAENSKSGKTILFIDEIDAIGNRTSGLGSLNTDTITELLTQLDGFDEESKIVVIAATNNPGNLDEALTRAGRFNKIIEIGLPDVDTRQKLLAHYMKKRPHSKTIDFKKIATATNNYSPAEIKELTEKAATIAFKNNCNTIEFAHMIAGIEEGLQEKILKGNTTAQQQLDALEVIFKGKTSSKGFNQIIGGVPVEIADLKKMLDGALDYKKFGLSFPKGILFTGPPGTGKTLLAKAIAEELGCEFLETKASDFVNKYVGVGAATVRKLFEDARKKAKGNHLGKTIIFIDELDAIGSRSNNDNDGGETRRTLVELLGQMDGFSKDESVIVIAATNQPNRLDNALKRAGRFDTIIEIGLPDKTKRKALLQFYTKNRPIASDVSFDSLADSLGGCNAADMKEVVNIAARIAMRAGKSNITQADFDQALENIRDAQKSKSNNYV